MYSNYKCSEEHKVAIKSMAKKIKIVEVGSEEEALEVAPYAEIILGHRYLHQIISKAENVKWVQSSSSGFDHLPWKALRDRSIYFSTANISSQSIANHAVMLALALNRRLFDCFIYQMNKTWGNSLYNSLPGRPKTAIILGFGEIGKAIGKILKSMHIEVWAVKKTIDIDSMAIADKVFIEDDWKDSLNQVDFCFLALPLNDETNNIISSDVLEKFSPHSNIINVSRGELIDMDYLYYCLELGKIGGAGIDVFPGRKAIQKNSPIWDLPNLIITPYIASRYESRGIELEKYIEEQVYRYFNNQQLKNLIFP